MVKSKADGAINPVLGGQWFKPWPESNILHFFFRQFSERIL
jgi:hypothetical protein